MIFEIRPTCFARGSIHAEQRGLSRGCPASRDAISPELIGGQLGMDKAEKAGSWFGFRRGLKGRREGEDFVETKAIRGEKGKSQDDPRMSPDIGAAKSISRPRCRVQQVFVGEGREK